MAYVSKYAQKKRALKIARTRTGLGLFVLEDIPKGECIIEYRGRRISPKEEETSGSRYLFALNKTETLDGAARTNRARYINHSHRPNCEVEIYRKRIYVLSKRRVKAGEQLFINYGKDYFDQFIKQIGCKCYKCVPPKRGERTMLPGFEA